MATFSWFCEQYLRPNLNERRGKLFAVFVMHKKASTAIQISVKQDKKIEKLELLHPPTVGYTKNSFQIAMQFDNKIWLSPFALLALVLWIFSAVHYLFSIGTKELSSMEIFIHHEIHNQTTHHDGHIKSPRSRKIPANFLPLSSRNEFFYPVWIFETERWKPLFFRTKPSSLKNEISCNRDLHILKVKTEKNLFNDASFLHAKLCFYWFFIIFFSILLLLFPHRH